MSNARRASGGPPIEAPPDNWASKIAEGWDTLFNFTGQGLGLVSTIPFLGVITRVPVSAMRGLVDGHDEMVEKVWAKRVQKNPDLAQKAADACFTMREKRMIREAGAPG